MFRLFVQLKTKVDAAVVMVSIKVAAMCTFLIILNVFVIFQRNGIYKIQRVAG